MNLAQRYIEGLKQAYLNAGGECAAKWRHFESVIHGMDEAGRQKLLEMYPDIPKSLLELLEFVDGTYFREYGDERLTFYFLGSDVEDGGYPYYLYSAEQLIEDSKQIYSDNFADLFCWYLEDKDNEDGIYVDERIQMDGTQTNWLCFSDCMNNGGSSSLFIDFTPAEGGKKGQIIRYLHDPDELAVIADSFDEYLEMLIEKKYAFVDPEFF